MTRPGHEKFARAADCAVPSASRFAAAMTRNGERQSDIERLAYSPGELAKALGISKTYAYRLVRSGRIRALRVGSRWLVPVREVDAFLAERKDARKEIGT